MTVSYEKGMIFRLREDVTLVEHGDGQQWVFPAGTLVRILDDLRYARLSLVKTVDDICSGVVKDYQLEPVSALESLAAQAE